MTEKSSGERKKLSLSLEGKLSLKNSVNSKISGSVTTNNRSGRNTVQVEVKRVKRTSENLDSILKKSNESNSVLSAEQISTRSKQLKEGLAKTAAEAEVKAYNNLDKQKKGTEQENILQSSEDQTGRGHKTDQIKPSLQESLGNLKKEKTDDVNKNIKRSN